MFDIETDKHDMPPARPKPKTSHTEIWEGGGGAWFVPVALVAIVVLGVLAVLGLKLQAWLIELVGICG